jgi:hypothetical protein
VEAVLAKAAGSRQQAAGGPASSLNPFKNEILAVFTVQNITIILRYITGVLKHKRSYIFPSVFIGY